MRIDRRLGKFGRWAGISGTDDPDTHKAINAMLTQLKRDRDWKKLALIVNRIMRPVDLYESLLRGEADTLPTGDEGRPLQGSVEYWLTNADLEQETKDSYERCLGALYRAHATVGDLPALIKRAREKAITSGKRRNFNLTRSAGLSFFRTTFDDRHPLYDAVRRIEELSVNPRDGNPQTVEQIRDIAPTMGDDAGSLWSFCLTAMRRMEYFEQRYKVLEDRIQVRGLKGDVLRVIPKVYGVTAPRIGESHFYHKLVRVTGGAVNIHDLRKTAQRWQEDAGVADWRVSYYAGHVVSRDMRKIYRKPREMARLLTEDAARVREYVGEKPEALKALRLA